MSVANRTEARNTVLVPRSPVTNYLYVTRLHYPDSVFAFSSLSFAASNDRRESVKPRNPTATQVAAMPTNTATKMDDLRRLKGGEASAPAVKSSSTASI